MWSDDNFDDQELVSFATQVEQLLTKDISIDNSESNLKLLNIDEVDGAKISLTIDETYGCERIAEENGANMMEQSDNVDGGKNECDHEAHENVTDTEEKCYNNRAETTSCETVADENGTDTKEKSDTVDAGTSSFDPVAHENVTDTEEKCYNNRAETTVCETVADENGTDTIEKSYTVDAGPNEFDPVAHENVTDTEEKCYNNRAETTGCETVADEIETNTIEKSDTVDAGPNEFDPVAHENVTYTEEKCYNNRAETTGCETVADKIGTDTIEKYDTVDAGTNEFDPVAHENVTDTEEKCYDNRAETTGCETVAVEIGTDTIEKSDTVDAGPNEFDPVADENVIDTEEKCYNNRSETTGCETVADEIETNTIEKSDTVDAGTNECDPIAQANGIETVETSDKISAAKLQEEDSDNKLIDDEIPVNASGNATIKGASKCGNKVTNIEDEPKGRKRKKKPTRKKLKYTSSSDDDIPLSMLVNRFIQSYTSDNDASYIPNSKDLNSTDTEYYSDLSDSSKMHHKKEKQLKKDWNETVKYITKNKKPHTTRKQRKAMSSEYNESGRESNLEQIKELSYNEEIIRKTLIVANEGRLDRFLNNEGLRREKVPPHGNCFFHAACHSFLVSESHTQLRNSLCSHLEENALEYMGFLINKYSPEKEEEFIADYLLEIENLKKNGYWSNKVADFLPLALANYAGCTVTIYTSKPDQEKISIEPTLKQNECNNELKLAYISVPNIMEHYDACVLISDYETAEFIASPLPSASTDMPEPSHGNASANVSQTPKKTAKFVSPVKKKLFRKRKATPENWKKNIRKRLRLSGEEYLSISGKAVLKKQVQECNCSKCKYKCNTKVSYEQRCAIRDFYYGLETYERQKDYICSNVQEKNTKTHIDDDGNKIAKKKQVMRCYCFNVNKEKVRVCKKFFLKTLSISETTVTQALSKKVCGHFQGRDERGRHVAPNKTNEEKLSEIRNHIESFPTVESHYIRKETNRQFLAPDLNIKRMYEEYVSKCKEKGTESVNEPIYRRVFNEEYNLSFHVPKKDQCTLCNKYLNAKADGKLDEKLKEEYKLHQERKLLAREEKHKDSGMAKQDNKVKTCTFDLQSVLYTPCSLVSLMYYMRKLCCYNLSIYSAGDKKATCYLWSETDGKRGSNEISTCLNLYLSRLEAPVEHVILYSDSCAGQNKNQIVASCLLHSVTTIPGLKTIDHKFLESGHTHMECDSMHSAIEYAKSKTKIFVPSQWETVISMARRKNPYHVVNLKYYDFKDFKGKSKTPRASKTEGGMKPKWKQMKWIRFLKNDPEICLFKYSLEESEDFQRVRITGGKRLNDQIQPAYKGKLPISSAKKKDLITLCKQGVIPSEFYEYYKGLSASQAVKERLPEPDKEESDDDTDMD